MTKTLFDACVNTMEEQAISTIMNNNQLAGYGSTDDAVRFHSPDPYTSVWIIKDAEEQERNYSPAHRHDFAEQNILVGAPGDLVYRILLGTEEREIESPTTVVIPPYVTHSANLVRGFGAFVVIRFIPEQIQSISPLIYEKL